jgi:hypothetical protein
MALMVYPKERYQMTIPFERQELRALALLPIRQLPAYSADYTVTCRVGIIVSCHLIGITPATYGRDLEKTLDDNVLREKIPEGEGGLP